MSHFPAGQQAPAREHQTDHKSHQRNSSPDHKGQDRGQGRNDMIEGEGIHARGIPEHADDKPAGRRGGESDRRAGRCQREHRNPHRASALVGTGRGFRSRFAEEDDAERLRETCRRETADERQTDHEAERRVDDGGLLRDDALERAEVDQELADESVQRRQGADRRGADEEERACPRHALQQSAKTVHIARARRMRHRPRPEEQQALERGVIDHMKKGARESRHRDGQVAVAHAEQSEPESERDDPGVFDRRIRQQAFHIALRQREENAENAGYRADPDQRQPPPGGRRAQECQNAKQAVDSRLDHHARHERGNVAGRRRMRFRQPHVKRHEAGLRSEADDSEEEQDACGRGGRRAERDEIERPRGAPEQEKQREQERGADVRGDKIRPPRPAHVILVVFERHKEKGSQRHELPRHEKQRGVSRDHDHDHARNQRIEEEPRSPRGSPAAPCRHVLLPVDGGQGGKDEDRNQEEGRQQIDFNRQRAVRHAPRPEPRFRDSSRQNANRLNQADHASRDSASHSERGRKPR